MELQERVREFTRQTVAAMGMPLEVAVIETPDSIRVELSGEGGEVGGGGVAGGVHPGPVDAAVAAEPDGQVAA